MPKQWRDLVKILLKYSRTMSLKRSHARAEISQIVKITSRPPKVKT